MLEQLIKTWRAKADASRVEADRINRTVKARTEAESNCYARAQVWEQCVQDLEAAAPGWWHPIDVDIEISEIWFWWNGDHTFPVNISRSDGRLFACVGQWGWSRPQWLTDMGGLWTPCIPPEPNKVQQGEAVMEIGDGKQKN